VSSEFVRSAGEDSAKADAGPAVCLRTGGLRQNGIHVWGRSTVHGREELERAVSGLRAALSIVRAALRPLPTHARTAPRRSIMKATEWPVSRRATPSDPRVGLAAFEPLAGIRWVESRGGRVEFKPDELVVHPRYGIGCVVRLAQRQFGSNRAQEYYEIAIGSGTIWVPAGVPGHGLRRVTSRTDLNRYRKLLRSQAVPLATDSKQRKTDLAERMKQGTFESRCEVLRDLCAQRSIKPLDENSGALLRKVREMLCAEWAAAEGLSPEDAAGEVDALLLEGREIHSSSAT